MSTALTTREFSKDQVELIKRTIAPLATPQEFELFLYRCQHMDLDPLKPGEIYFIKYGTTPGTIVIGIEGFRKRAERSGKRSGIKRGVLRDDKGKCVGAWCEVFRSDWKESAREEVSLAEYNTGKSNWAKMPETMIKKVAEAAALRLAFPDELGGIYLREEMDQADPSQRDVTPPDNEPTKQALPKPSIPDKPGAQPEKTGWRSAGETVIRSAKKEWENLTIREVVDKIGLPAFMKDVDWWATQSGRKEWKEIQYLAEQAEAFQNELKANHEDIDAALGSLSQDDFDSAYAGPK